MRITPQQMQHIAHLVLQKWKEHNVVEMKGDETAVINSAVKALQADYQKELDLEKEVQKMMDTLERTNPGEFQRHKMYPLLKQKLAKEKKVVL